MHLQILYLYLESEKNDDFLVYLCFYIHDAISRRLYTFSKIPSTNFENIYKIQKITGININMVKYQNK